MKSNTILSIDIVLPVYNEEYCLEENVNRVCAYLRSNALYSWRVIIADNASIDKTPVIATELASKIDEVDVVRFERKGRGYALRSAFQKSQADAAIYMDIDLSTSLCHINELIEALEGGHDIAVGSRLLPDSSTERRVKREIISRGYNILVRIMFGRICSDFQCGFKAFRCNVFQDLLPRVKDNKFFFDTEIMILANQFHYRVIDVPINWIEDTDSRVDLIPTIIDDLMGLVRVRLGLFFGRSRAKTRT